MDDSRHDQGPLWFKAWSGALVQLESRPVVRNQDICFISLIQYLNFAGLLQYFAVISSTFQLLLIINAPTWSPSPSNTHSLSTIHCLLLLVLLVSRPLIMMAASQAKLPPTSKSPRKPSPPRALAGKGADKQPEQQLITIM
jgi:hypothetical protein